MVIICVFRGKCYFTHVNQGEKYKFKLILIYECKVLKENFKTSIMSNWTNITFSWVLIFSLCHKIKYYLNVIIGNQSEYVDILVAVPHGFWLCIKLGDTFQIINNRETSWILWTSTDICVKVASSIWMLFKCRDTGIRKS